MIRLMSRMVSWLRSVTGRQRLEGEMEEEIRFHLDARAADLAREGMDFKQAMRQARLEFGGVASHKDGMRRSLGLRWWDELWGDVRYATRILRKSPGFTLIAVSSLALAIGANTTIFSVANEMLFERLGVPHPRQLRLLAITEPDNSIVHMSWGSDIQLPNGQSQRNAFTYPIYQQLRDRNRDDNKVLEDIFAFKDIGRVNVTVNGLAQSANAQLVSGNFYRQMQVQPMLGRTILPSDDREVGKGPVVVISDAFWNRAFGRAPGVVGKMITINMTPMTIIGVNPLGFTGAESVQWSPDLFAPLSMMPMLRETFGDPAPIMESTQLYWLQVMARTKAGVSDEQARTSLDLVMNAAIRSVNTIGKNDAVPHLMIEDGSKGLNVAQMMYAEPLHVLLAMVASVLIMACANMANLMLARASARHREMSVRLALGSGRWRLLRQVLTESLLLSTAGGTAGLLLGYFGRTALPKFMATAWTTGELQVPFNWKVFAFTAGITIGTGIIFGIFPAWSATRVGIGVSLQRGVQTASRRRKAWSGKAIVALQVALSTMLVVAALLFLRTLVKLNSIDPGFRAEHLLMFQVNPPTKQYPPPRDVRLGLQLEEALRAVPGVQEIATSDVAPVSGSDMNGGFEVQGRPEEKFSSEDRDHYPYFAHVGVHYFSTMQIPILAGRGFTAQDTETSQKVSVINQTLARKFFGSSNPIGQHFRQHEGADAAHNPWIEIIGVCADSRYEHMKRLSQAVHYDLLRQQIVVGGLTYLVRTPMKPEAVVPSLRAAVQRVDRDLPLMDIRTMEQQIGDDLQQERMFASLSAGFGVLALMLACIGIYGIMAYTVVQRTNEIGIRLALGAERGQVRGMVLREAGGLAVIGVASGLVVALGLGRLVKSLLYGLQPADPLSLAGAGCLLLGLALIAGWVPAMRASRVEPMEALRHE